MRTGEYRRERGISGAGRRRSGTARIVGFAVLAIGGAALAGEAFGWGFQAHRIVAEAATERVGGPLGGFLRAGRSAISDASLEPDTLLKDADPQEAPRHFIDLDTLFPDAGSARPYPADLAAAQSRFGAERLEKEGVLPWWIAAREGELVKAMRRGDSAAILRESGWVSHYVADLHQPLHLTSNFDGQKTGNEGIHSAFERFLIDQRQARFRPAAGEEERERAIGSVADWALARARRISRLVPRILDADRKATLSLKRDGASYYDEMEKSLGPLVRRLLEDGARATAQIWMAAWIDAGRPDPAAWPRSPAVERHRVAPGARSRQDGAAGSSKE